jgi:hypothetical protein
MDNEILEIIRKTIPEKEVGVIREVFARCAELEGAVVRLNELEIETHNKLQAVCTVNKELESTVLDLRTQVAGFKIQKTKIHEYEKELKHKELELLKKELKLESEVPKAEAEAFKYIFNTIYRVLTVREKAQIPLVQTGFSYNPKTGNQDIPFSNTITGPSEKVTSQE